MFCRDGAAAALHNVRQKFQLVKTFPLWHFSFPSCLIFTVVSSVISSNPVNPLGFFSTKLQGDWRLLHLLAHNMNPLVFAEFVIQLDLQVSLPLVRFPNHYFKSVGEPDKPHMDNVFPSLHPNHQKLWCLTKICGDLLKHHRFLDHIGDKTMV